MTHAMIPLLVVEADPGVRRLLERALPCAGYQPTLVATAAAACQALATTIFAAVLTHYGQRGETGWQVIAAAQQVVPPPLIVVMTGHSPGTLAAVRHVLPPIILLHKPFAMTTLSMLLTQGLARAPTEPGRPPCAPAAGG